MTRQHYLCIDVGEDGAILLAEQSKDSEASSSLAKSDQSSSVDASEGVRNGLGFLWACRKVKKRKLIVNTEENDTVLIVDHDSWVWILYLHDTASFALAKFSNAKVDRSGVWVGDTNNS